MTSAAVLGFESRPMAPGYLCWPQPTSRIFLPAAAAGFACCLEELKETSSLWAQVSARRWPLSKAHERDPARNEEKTPLAQAPPPSAGAARAPSRDPAPSGGARRSAAARSP